MNLPHKNGVECLQKPLYALNDPSCTDNGFKKQKSIDDFF
jgi:hypothetical protein